MNLKYIPRRQLACAQHYADPGTHIIGLHMAGFRS